MKGWGSFRKVSEVSIDHILLCATSVYVKDAITSGESVNEPAEVEEMICLSMAR